ncbi:hypothetical protein KA013_04030 [Patescibacteria group bacterium]|nr:hypothetical protein [Patescibacteria group bacterium]
MEIPDTSPLPTAEAPVVEADSFDSDWIRQDSGSDNNEPTQETPPAEPVAPTTPEVRMKTIYGGCHTRLINGVEKKSCYREIK